MARILVLYATSEGQTARIAHGIAMRLRFDDFVADVVQAGTADPRPSDYDGIIIAGSIHVGGYQKPIARWLRAHVMEIGDRPTAFVSVCLAVLSKQEKARDEARAIPRRFVDGLGWHPTLIKVVAGALPYTKYSFFTRWIMKRIVVRGRGRHRHLPRLRVHRLEGPGGVRAPSSPPARPGTW